MDAIPSMPSFAGDRAPAHLTSRAAIAGTPVRSATNAIAIATTLAAAPVTDAR
jgi:hypothetical protein